MDARAFRGMAVVTVDGAERLGRVDDVLFETEPLRVAALALETDRGQEAVPLSAIHRVGDDAIMVESRQKALSAEPRLAIDRMKDLQTLAKLKVVDDGGTFMGQVERVDVDPSTGAVNSMEVTRSNTFGLGGETTTVDIGQVQSVGDDLLTVRQRRRDLDLEGGVRHT